MFEVDLRKENSMDFFKKSAKEYLQKYNQNKLNPENIFFSRGAPFYIENGYTYELINGEKDQKINIDSLCDANVPCSKCGKLSDKNGHDPCLANLPGVKSACCGHGIHNGYITFSNGIVIIGKFEVKRIEDYQI